jgi:hypothetical protein
VAIKIKIRIFCAFNFTICLEYLNVVLLHLLLICSACNDETVTNEITQKKEKKKTKNMNEMRDGNMIEEDDWMKKCGYKNSEVKRREG